MGITLDRGYWYFVKRVPKRYAHVDPRQKVTQALWTDSEREARAKAPAVEAEFMAYWEALAAGESRDASAAFEATRKLAKARGFAYRSAADLAAGPLGDLLARIEALSPSGNALPAMAEAEALLGAIDVPDATVSAALEEFFRFSATERAAGKSKRQIDRWRKPRERAVATFIKLNGDLPMREVGRGHAQTLREHWAERIATEGMSPESANKDIGHLSDLFRSWFEYHALEAPNPFAKLRFRVKSTKTKGLPFSEDWIRARILADDAFAGLNEEARDVFLLMVNTGARPSELLGCTNDAFQLSASIPHLDLSHQIQRVMKTEMAPRKIPLLGVSLDAAKRILQRKGIQRYVDNSDGWSATVNKYLTENGLRETPKHSAYSLRHSFEDRMTEAGVDDRIRAELMGHKYERPDYGRGGSLANRADLLAPISF